MQMLIDCDFLKSGRIHRYGALFARTAVGLLLGCAVAVALIATVLDLIPLRP